MFSCIALGLLILFGSYRQAAAQITPAPDDPLRFLTWLSQDTKAIPRSLMLNSPVKLGIGTAAIFVVSRFDESLSEHSVDFRKRELMRVLEEVGDANAVRPLALIIFTGSLFSDNHRFQDAAFTSFQSLVYANLLTNAVQHGNAAAPIALEVQSGSSGLVLTVRNGGHIRRLRTLEERIVLDRAVEQRVLRMQMQVYEGRGQARLPTPTRSWPAACSRCRRRRG